MLWYTDSKRREIKYMDKFNSQSLIRFKDKHPEVVNSNQEFFSKDTMDCFGYQSFSVVDNGEHKFLTVDRSIVHNDVKVDLNTSVYELDDETSKVVKLVGSIEKKIRSISPFKRRKGDK